MISENRSHQLPLFGHFCCRLAAQPDCVSQESCSGDLTVLDGGTGRQWVFMWGQLQAFRLDLWVKREHWEQGQDPGRSITVDRVSETHFGDQAYTSCWLLQIMSNSEYWNLCCLHKRHYLWLMLSLLVFGRNRPHRHRRGNLGLVAKNFLFPPLNISLADFTARHWCVQVLAVQKVR